MPTKKLKIDEPVEEPTLEQEAIAAFESEIKGEPEPEAADPVEEKQYYITKETPIDKYTVKRTRVLLTPAVCDKCGFDVAERNSLGAYEDMTDSMKEQVKAAIKEHKEIVHTIATDLVVSEDEVPQEWLGQHKKF
jgi:hypothetical protein